MHSVEKKISANSSNQSTDKLLSLLEQLAVQDQPVRLQDLAKMLDMNASTLSRFLTPLQQRGYVAQDEESSRYYLTYKLCTLAQHITARQSIRNFALPFMRQVAHVFKETCCLCVESDKSVLYVEAVSVPGKTLMALQRIGHMAPLHCTGVGKVFLLEYSPQQLDELIATRGLERFTDYTITDRAALESRLAEIRSRGYSFDEEECELGVRCVAAPLRDYTGRIVAGISVNGPVSRMTDAHIHEHLPFLLHTAEQISHRLGWSATQASA